MREIPLKPGQLRVECPIFAAHTRHAFSLRGGGARNGLAFNQSPALGDDAQAVAANRLTLKALISAEDLPLLTVKQVHGNRLYWVSTSEKPAPEGVEKLHPQHLNADEILGEADGILCDSPGFILGVYTADCVPILISDGAGFVAALHGGWRGIAANIVGRALDFMLKISGKGPEAFHVVMGPCIGPKSFEVGPEVYSAMKKSLDLPDFVQERALRAGQGDRSYISMHEVIAYVCARQGVKALSRLPFDTHGDAGHFFSYRRERGQTGRHLSCVVSPLNQGEAR